MVGHREDLMTILASPMGHAVPELQVRAGALGNTHSPVLCNKH